MELFICLEICDPSSIHKHINSICIYNYSIFINRTGITCRIQKILIDIKQAGISFFSMPVFFISTFCVDKVRLIILKIVKFFIHNWFLMIIVENSILFWLISILNQIVNIIFIEWMASAVKWGIIAKFTLRIEFLPLLIELLSLWLF